MTPRRQPGSGRQVRTNGTRPTYGRPAQRSRSSQRPSFTLPTIQVQSSWIIAAAIATVVLVVLVVISHMTRLQHITVSGNRQLTSAHIQQIARDSLDRQWFGRNTVLANTSAIAKYIETTDPGVKQARVKRHLLGTLVITVQERQPSLNWKSGGQTYLLDADGTVIGDSKGAYVKLPTVTDSSNLPVKTGERVAPATFVAFCTQVVQALGAANIHVTGLTVPESTSEVYAQTDKNYLIKFDTTRSAAGEVSDLTAVLSQLTKAHKTPQQYVDLRIEHKAYYK